MGPQFRYCTSSDGTRIAYAIYGNGPALIYARPPAVGMHQMLAWPEPRAFLDALAARTTLVTLDRRGTGASARVVVELSVEAESRDIAAVADAAGLDTFTLFADGSAVAPCALYATEHRTRVARVVLWWALFSGHDATGQARQRREDWSYARRVQAGSVYPDGPVSLQRDYSRAMKDSISAEMAARYSEMYAETDFGALVARVAAPALVIQRQQDAPTGQGAVRLASLLANSELRLVTGNARTPFPECQAIVDAVFEFMGIDTALVNPSLHGESATAAATGTGRGTAIVLFTDIVDSTALTERMGDAAFRALSRATDDRVRAAIRDAGGTPVEGKVLGDGVMGIFASAADAISAARACVEAAGELPMHIGLHAGDVIHEDGNVYGGAVNIASRVCGLCAPGEILVTATVRDLARTSAGVVFEDRGEQKMKGVGEPVRVFAVRTGGA